MTVHSTSKFFKYNQAFKIFVLKINPSMPSKGREGSCNIKNTSFTKNKAIIRDKSKQNRILINLLTSKFFDVGAMTHLFTLPA